MSRPRQTVTHVPIDRLTAHPANIRDDLGDLTDMAGSIREHGILQPLTATEDLEHEGQLLLLAGHRRLGAARLAGLDMLPVIIRHDLTDEAEHLVVMLVENTQRQDLNPIERAEAYGALRNRGLSVGEIARRTGAKASTVSYYLNLLLLDEEEREEVRTGARGVTSVIADARAERQEERIRLAGRPVGRPKGRKTTPYFSDSHPLAGTARKFCDHRGVPKVGSVACGACWENAIRIDAGTQPASQPASQPAADGTSVKPYDEAVVLRRLDGDHSVRTQRSDRIELVRRCHAHGLSDGEAADLVGLTSQTIYRIRKDLGLEANRDAGNNPTIGRSA